MSGAGAEATPSIGSIAGPCLLTGSSGFIGGRLAARMAAAGRPVRCLVRVGSDTDALTQLGVEIVRADLVDPPALDAAAAGCSAVVHCAALVSDWATVAEIRAVNVTGTRNVLRAAARAGVRRFVHVSTTDVYGHPGASGVRESHAPAGFSNWYAQSKLEAERELRPPAAGAQGTEVVVLRPATVYGPGSQEVIGEIARAIRAGRMLLIDHGRAVAGLCYVENLIDAMLLALDRPAAAGGTFNVSDELDVTWAQLTADLAAGLGDRPPRLSLPYRPAAALARALEQGYRGLRRATGLTLPPLLSRQAVQVLGRDQDFSSRALRETLGWEPRTDYEPALAATIAWLRETL